LFLGLGQLFAFLLLPLKTHSIKRKKAMCCRRAGAKSMTGKRAEGMASGESKRAMAAGAGGILRTGAIIFYHPK
jgi:hypothetical protein